MVENADAGPPLDAPVDPDELEAAVGRPPGEWEATALTVGTAAGTAGVWRVRGEGWSAVLKMLRHSTEGHPHWLPGTHPDHWYYWRREALAYTSGLTSGLAGRLRGPHLLHHAERSDGSIALWLEDVGDPAGPTWAVRDYRQAAHDLGVAQGAVLARDAVPDAPWLSRGWLREYVGRREGLLRLLDDDGAMAGVDRAVVTGAKRLRSDTEVFLNALDVLPQTWNHYDFHPDNLFLVDGATVVADWSFVGIGPVGQDAGVLLADALLDFHVPPAQGAELATTIWGGYLAGLDDAGWNPPPRDVRLGMLLGATVRYAWIPAAIAAAHRDGVDRLNRRPLEVTVPAWEETMGFLYGLADEARRLLDQAHDDLGAC